MTDDSTGSPAKTEGPKKGAGPSLRLWKEKILPGVVGKGFRSPLLWLLFVLIVVLYWGLTLWGIAAPFQWGHHGYHAGFHGSNARTLLRYGDPTPAHYSGHASPPESTYYLHHPILMHPYLSLGFAVFGEHEWVVRGVPALFTFFALLALFWVTGRLWHPWVGLLACTVFVFLPQNLIFAHLIDHETPGLFYSILGGGSFLLWMERGHRRYGVLALVSLALSGLSDWPPYLIAFYLGLYGWGQVWASTTLSTRWEKALPRGTLGTAAVALMAGAIAYALKTHTEFPAFYQIALVLGAVVAMSTDPRPARDFTDNTATGGTSPPFKTQWISIDRRWLRLMAWGFVAVAAMAFHFYYTYAVGAWPDLKAAFNARSGGGLDDTFFKNYYKYILKLMFTEPLLLVGLVWTLLLPVRILWGRLPGRAALPVAFLCAQLFHNLKFPNEINMHNYRAYYYAGFFPLAFADLTLLVAQGIRRLHTGLQHRGWRPLRRYLFSGSAAAAAGLVAAYLVAWQAQEAWPSYKLSRERGGTLSVTPYRSHRHKIRFYREVHRLTTPETFVLYGPGLRPRFEPLYYLDRDYGSMRRAPRDLQAAQRVARRRFWRPRLPKPKNRVLFRLWPDLTEEELRGAPPPRKRSATDAGKSRRRRRRARKPLPPFHRPVAALLDLRRKDSRQDLARLFRRHTVRIFHPMALVLYDGKGPDLKAWRFAARTTRGWERYFQWREKKLVLHPDPGLVKHWKKRLQKARLHKGRPRKRHRKRQPRRRARARARVRARARAQARPRTRRPSTPRRVPGAPRPRPRGQP